MEEFGQDEWAVVDDLRQLVRKVDPFGHRTVLVRTRLSSHLSTFTSSSQVLDKLPVKDDVSSSPIFYLSLLSSVERDKCADRAQFLTRLLQAEERDKVELTKLGTPSR